MSHNFGVARQDENQQSISIPPRGMHGLARASFSPVSVDGTAMRLSNGDTQPQMAGFSPFFPAQLAISNFDASFSHGLDSNLQMQQMPQVPQMQQQMQSPAHQMPYNLESFLAQGRLDRPWVGAANLYSSGPSGNTAFTAYRNVPSEYGHQGLLSDSGYGTGQQSLHTPSVYGDVDRSHDTRSLAGHLDSFHVVDGGAKQPLVCPDCNETVKTKSDLKKHDQKHNKRHHCTVEGCSRVDRPFSTVNDLDRHRKSVHNQQLPGPSYRCTIAKCVHPTKIWPRADNFRQHLKRIHNLDYKANHDLKQFVVDAMHDSTTQQSSTETCLTQTSPSRQRTPTEVPHDTATIGRSESPPPSSDPSCAAQTPYDMGPSDHLWPSLDMAPHYDERAGEAEVECLDDDEEEEEAVPVPAELSARMTRALQVFDKPQYTTQHVVSSGVGLDMDAMVDVSQEATQPSPVVSLEDEHSHHFQQQQHHHHQQPLQHQQQQQQQLFQHHHHHHHQQQLQYHEQESHQPSQNMYELGSGPSAFHGSVDAVAELDADANAISPIHGLFAYQPAGTPGLPSEHLRVDLDQGGILDSAVDERDSSIHGYDMESYVSDPEDTAQRSPCDQGAEFSGEDEQEDDDMEPIPDTLLSSDDSSASRPESSPVDAQKEETPDSPVFSSYPVFPPPETSWQQEPNHSRLWDFLSTIPRSILEIFLQRSHEADSMGEFHTAPQSPDGDCPHKCKKCSKGFMRRCDLKKHSKRHDKPYCCTFPPCPKKFGSKNDWKRHETGQHLDVRVWSCNEPATGASPSKEASNDGMCGATFTQRHLFSNHLQKEHGIHDERSVDDKLDNYSNGMGRFDSWFWCGFCCAKVPTKEGRNTFSERFDHIDDHFFGRNDLPKKAISEWGECPRRQSLAMPSSSISAAKHLAPTTIVGKKRTLSDLDDEPPHVIKRMKRE